MRKQILPIGVLALAVGLGACGKSTSHGVPTPMDQPDLVVVFDNVDGGGGPIATDDMDPGMPNVCGDTDPACKDVPFGGMSGAFPLQGDPMKSPGEKDNGVNRDPNGYLGLDSTHSVFNYLWIANSSEGTTSKIDSKTVREVGRYITATCYSFLPPTGGTQACDGKTGCCAIDDYPNWQARKNKQPKVARQSVQITNNSPSRTAVDFNGDLFISNRAFSGQSSVTKVANDIAACIDRNKDGKIQTSSDTNANGYIETDCNGNGTPDNIADVKMTPCTNGLKQEFYGQDDECVLWTSNTFTQNQYGRPLGLAAGANDSAVSDAWAGGYQNGLFVRIDGTTGLDKDEAQLPGGCNPYGLAVDSTGYGWAPNLGQGPLCYFDTKNTKNVGQARDPSFGKMSGYGVTLDRDQNVWVGLGVERYTPDRSNGFKNIGQGYWTKIGGANGIGIAADSRSAKAYFVYSCNSNQVLQIPASTLPVPKGMDVTVPNPGWPTIAMPCYGVGVDTDQNVWGVSMQMATRGLVDKAGVITQPKVNTPPMGNNKCPAGDQCPMNGGPYTYSDFTGFGLRNFTRPSGSYTIVVPGCSDNGAPTDTEWDAIVWDAIVPPNTTLTVHARAGNTPIPDNTWMNMPTSEGLASPFSLQNGTLSPNLPANTTNIGDAYLEVQFTFKTNALNASPKLKSFDVGFKCKTVM